MIEKSNYGYKVYIYGGGCEYNRFTSYLPLYQEKLTVLGIVTTEKNINSYIDGFPCITVEEINENEMDYVIIAVKEWKEIAKLLYEKGIDESKIIRSSVFYNPCFDLDEYLKLKVSNISILSNFCLGGHIYRDLGLKVLSPTVNMFCLSKDYLEFIRHYEYYLNAEMKEYERSQYIKGTMGMEAFIPKGILGDKVVWYFNHNTYATEAIAKWNERAKRVNFDNIAVLMTLHTDEDAYQFSELNIEKKLGIYYKDLGLKDIIYCQLWNEENTRFLYHNDWSSFANIYMMNFKGSISPINWIKFLNGEKDYRRF